MGDVLPSVGLMKEIDFLIKLQEEILTVLYSLFEKIVTVYKDN